MNSIVGKNVRQYEKVVLRNSAIGDNTVLGDDVFVTDSVIGNYCSIERRGMIFNSRIDKYSYSGYNAVIKYADIGKYCSISWNVSIGGANHDYKCMTTHPFPFNSKYGFCEIEGGGVFFFCSAVYNWK